MEQTMQNLSGLLHKYNDKFLADDSLSDVDVLLLSLHLIEQKNNKAGTQYEQLKHYFSSLGRKESSFRFRMRDAKKQGLIEEKDEIWYFTIKGLKKIWAISGQIGKSGVYLIKSGEHFTAIKLLEEFLQTEIKHEEILLFDPHIAPNTLNPFSILKGKLKHLKILTSNIYEENKFRDYKTKFERELNSKVEIRINMNGHDRWLICGERCWAIGSSIKDIGNKDTSITELPGVALSLSELFETRWKESKQFS